MGKISVETSCGKRFELLISELTDYQLNGLLAENGDRADDPQVAALWAELERRRGDPPEAA